MHEFISVVSILFHWPLCLFYASTLLFWWERKWWPSPMFLPGKSHGQRSLTGCSPWSCKELDSTLQLNNGFENCNFVIYFELRKWDVSSFFLFLLKISFVTQGLLWFHMNFSVLENYNWKNSIYNLIFSDTYIKMIMESI